MSKVHFFPLGVVAALCLGCAEERSLEPQPAPKLPAMSLTFAPTVAVSDPIYPSEVDSAEWNSRVYSFLIPDSIFSAAAQPNDVHVAFTRWGTVSFALVLNPITMEWLELHTDRYCPLQYPPYCEVDTWLLSRFTTTPIDVFRDMSRWLRLKSADGCQPVMRLVSYDRRYRAVTVVPHLQCTPSQLAYGDGQVWVSTMTAHRMTDVCNDSIIAFDLSGTPTRKQCTWCSWSGCDGMAFGDGTLWLRSPDDKHVLRVWQDGTYEAAFGTPWDPRSHEGGMAWVDGEIWMAIQRGGPIELVGINVAASLDSGQAVIDESWLVDLSGNPLGMTWDGQYLNILVDHLCRQAIARSVYRFTVDGKPVDTLPAPGVLLEAIAWDGEALWALHHGPIEASTDATLLSRFYVP